VTAGRPVGEARFVRAILLPVRTPSLRRVFHDSDHAECRGVFIPTPFIVFFARNARIGGRSLWGGLGKTVFWP